MSYAIQTAFDHAHQWFLDRGGGVEFTAGFDAVERFQENTAARCAWVPGDPTKVMSAFTADPGMINYPPEQAAAFGLIKERFSIVASACDESNMADFWLQYNAVKVLHNELRKALNDLTVTFTRVDWVTSSKIFQHGLALRLNCEVEELLLLDDPGETYVFPWTARSRVYNNASLVETIDSPHL